MVLKCCALNKRKATALFAARLARCHSARALMGGLLDVWIDVSDGVDDAVGLLCVCIVCILCVYCVYIVYCVCCLCRTVAHKSHITTTPPPHARIPA